MTEMKLLLKCDILLECGMIEMGFQLEWGSKQNEIQWKKQETKDPHIQKCRMRARTQQQQRAASNAEILKSETYKS